MSKTVSSWNTSVETIPKIRQVQDFYSFLLRSLYTVCEIYWWCIAREGEFEGRDPKQKRFLEQTTAFICHPLKLDATTAANTAESLSTNLYELRRLPGQTVKALPSRRLSMPWAVVKVSGAASVSSSSLGATTQSSSPGSRISEAVQPSHGARSSCSSHSSCIGSEISDSNRAIFEHWSSAKARDLVKVRPNNHAATPPVAAILSLWRHLKHGFVKIPHPCFRTVWPATPCWHCSTPTSLASE